MFPPVRGSTRKPSRSDLLGALIRRNVAKGEALLSADALNPGDRGFLAAVLGPACAPSPSASTRSPASPAWSGLAIVSI